MKGKLAGLVVALSLIIASPAAAEEKAWCRSVAIDFMECCEWVVYPLLYTCTIYDCTQGPICVEYRQ